MKLLKTKTTHFEYYRHLGFTEHFEYYRHLGFADLFVLSIFHWLNTQIFWSLGHWRHSSEIRLMCSLDTSIFLYACESWILTAELQRRIQAKEIRCYHKILCSSQKDHVTNEELHAKIQQAIRSQEDLLTFEKRCKLQWYGHVSHSSGLGKTILQGTVKGRRRQGRQKKRQGRQHQESQRAVENREKMEETGCEIICGAPRILTVKWQVKVKVKTQTTHNFSLWTQQTQKGVVPLLILLVLVSKLLKTKKTHISSSEYCRTHTWIVWILPYSSSWELLKTMHISNQENCTMHSRHELILHGVATDNKCGKLWLEVCTTSPRNDGNTAEITDRQQIWEWSSAWLSKPLSKQDARSCTCAVSTFIAGNPTWNHSTSAALFDAVLELSSTTGRVSMSLETCCL